MAQDPLNLGAAVLRSEEDEQRRRVQGAGQTLYRARGGPTPERAALAQRAAAVLGAAPIEVQDDDGLLEEAQAREDLAALRDHQASINWLSNPENAAVGRDQVRSLTQMERQSIGLLAAPAAAPQVNLGPGYARDMLWLSGVARAPLEGLGLALGATVQGSGSLGEMYGRATGNTAMQQGSEIIRQGGRQMNRGARNVGGTSTPEEQRNLAMPLAPNVVDRGLAGDVASGVGQVAGQIAITTASAGTLTLPSLFAQGAGAMDERVEQDLARDGRTERTARDDAAVLGGAVVTAAAEKLGLDAILGRLPKPIRDRITNRLVDVFVAGAVEGSSEVVEGIGQNVIANAALDEGSGVLDGTVEGGTVGALTGSVVRSLILTAIPGRQYVENQVRAEVAPGNADRFDQLAESVAANPLLERSPERLRAFLESATDGSNVYVPAEAAATFFQSNPDLAEWIDEWDIRDQYEAAIVSGADIAIPKALYLTTVAQTPAHEAWRNDLRHGIDAMSVKEAEEFAANGEAELTAGFDQAMTDAEAIGQQTAPQAAVYNALFSELRAAGYTIDAAQTQATLAATYFNRRAERSGGRFADAMAAYRDANLSIRQEFPESIRQRMDQTDVLIEALRASRKAPSQQAVTGRSLAEFISAEGGIDDTGGELTAMGANQWHRGKRPGTRKLIRAGEASGRFGSDSVAQRAIEAGYLPEGADGNALFEALREEMAGRPVYSREFERDMFGEETRGAVDDLEAVLANLGIDPVTATNAEIKAALDTFANAPEATADATYNQFAGQNAEGAPLADLEQAKAMEAAGELPSDIWEATGWGRGDDGKWRFEISDEGAALKPDALERTAALAMSGQNTTALSEVFDHPRLFEAYPALADTKTAIMDLPSNASGMVARDENGQTIVLLNRETAEKDPDKAAQILIHEVQHLIQTVEGFAMGASTDPEALRAAGYGDVLEEQTERGNGAEWERQQETRRAAFKVYRRSAGEIEARNTEKRREYTDEERRLFPPAYTRDIQSDEAIVRFEGGDQSLLVSEASIQEASDPADPRILYQIPPEVAAGLNYETRLPEDPIFAEAVGNTKGAEITPDGLVMSLIRNQKPEQHGATSVRTGVFYLPEGSANARFYAKTGAGQYYGGPERISGQTLLKAPLFVKGATGGKAPQVAFDTINGKGAYAKLEKDVMHVVSGSSHLRREGLLEEAIDALLTEYGAETDTTYEISENSRQGNQLRYALQENIIAHAVRAAGYDSVVGYSKGKNGAVISEVFDLREDAYPTPEGDYSIHRNFYQQARGQISLSDTGAVITLFRSRDLSTFFHEFGHLTLELLVKDAGLSAEARADLDAAMKHLGITNPSEIGVEQHELWARSFETYLTEGKAPTLELRSVFRTVKAWMLSIYRTALNLNAPITDEVRAVFDRLLASEDQLADAKAQLSMEADLSDLEREIMTPAQQAEYARLVDRATGDAESAMLARVMDTVRRQRTAEWNAEADELRPDVSLEVDDNPDIKALAWLKAASATMDRAVVIQMMGDEAGVDLLPRGAATKKGRNAVHPDTLAEVAGYPSGQAMLNALMEHEAERRTMRAAGDNRSVRAKRIEDIVTERLRERYGDALSDGSIQTEAVDALHGEKMDRAISVRWAAVARSANLPPPPPLASLRAWAAEKIGSRTVREAKPGRYLRAERKAATAAIKALKAGNRIDGARQLQIQTINRLLYSEARKAETDADAALKRLSRLDNARTIKSIDQDYLEQVHALLEQYELRRASGALMRRRVSLLQWVEEQKAAGHDVIVPPHLLDEARLRNYADLTVDELRGLNATVMQIVALGKLKRKMKVNGETRALDAVAQEARASADHLPNVRQREGLKDKEGWVRSMVDYGVQFEASLVKVQEWCRILDGGDPAGIFATVLDRPSMEASNKQTRLDAAFFNPIIDAEKAIPAKVKNRWLDRLENHPFMNPDTGEPLNGVLRRDLLPAALNAGTFSNFESMAKGWGFVARNADPAQVEAARQDFIAYLDGELDVTEWQYVQAWWTGFEQQRAAYFATARELNGYAPDPVEAAPLMTSAGELTGGYVPLAYDPKYDKLQQERDKVEVQDIFGGTMGSGPRPDNGSTKERSGYFGPVHIDLDKIASNARKHIAYISHGPFIANSLRFINHPVVAKTIRDKLGTEAYDTLEPWLASQVKMDAPLDPSANGLIKAMRWSRKNMTGALLLGSFNVLMAQPGGLFVSASTLGVPRMAGGVMKAANLLATGRFEEFIFGRSDFMKNRLNEAGLDRDIRLALARNKGKRGKREMAAFAMGRMIAAVDVYVVSGPTWLAAYDQALADGREESEAIYVADRAAEATQGGGRAASLAAIQRNNEVTKMATFAYGWANAFYNIQRGAAADIKNGVNRMNAVQRAAAILILPAIADALFSGDWPDWEDPESVFAWFARNVFFGAFSGIPVVRDMAGQLERKAAGKYAGPIGQTALGRIWDEVSKLGDDAWAIAEQAAYKVTDGRFGSEDEEPSKRWPAHAINTTGFVAGVPATAQMSRTTNYIMDVQSGDQNPDGVIDWMVGLLKGPQDYQKE